MSRAFLSHSSFDKDFVATVYDQLGAGRCHFDARTFPKNTDLAVQIREGIEDCDVYVLFLSAAAIGSNWVQAELDVALEMRTRWKIRSVMVFQLDETKWDVLPAWAHRHVVSCPPSPHQVALRIADELRRLDGDSTLCYGRDDDVRRAVALISEAHDMPAYLYFSGPIGIGRRTFASEIYKSYFPHVAKTNIEISVDQLDDLLDIYRRALAYSSNWRARDYRDAVNDFIALTLPERAKELAQLLHNISTSFSQVVVINVGTSALTEEGKPQGWFVTLTNHLTPSDYPYVWFVSQRFLSGNNLKNGLFFAVEQLSDDWSRFLFKVLIQKHQIRIPSRDEQSRIESSIAGHPGLIVLVTNYLRTNPQYKPNRTHNNIVRMINEITQELLAGFVAGNPERAKAIALYSEASILSYADIQRVAAHWAEFEEATSSLLDAGLLVRLGSDYALVGYIGRAAEAYGSKYKNDLAGVRRLLLEEIESIGEGSFLPIQLLDARIVEHILDNKPISGYLSGLIMPSQQIRAAKRRYDSQDYGAALRLAREAYSQSEKLSDNGRREAWRLIGLSGINAPDSTAFDFFLTEYPKQKKSAHTDAIFYFGNGLKCRREGDLRRALSWYTKIATRHADSHVYREQAYVYAFERSFDEAQRCITKAHELAFGNPYILDVLAVVLLERYKGERRSVSIQDIDVCLDQLREADERDDTKFYYVRAKMREAILNDDLSSLQELFAKRRSLPLAAKVSLLSMLSLKDKDLQFNELRGELAKILREKRNPLADIEIARIDIEHMCAKRQFADAEALLSKYRDRLTQKCVEDLERLLPASTKGPRKAH
jgi:hypothetical protein